MKTIPVFYTELMLAESESASPSSAKPAHVVASWKEMGVGLDVRDYAPVSSEDLCRAHSPTYVEKVLGCKINNGFGNRSPQVAGSLPYTSGSMLAAAREALANKEVAVAPCSGFHHAEYAEAQGFCTFNGLMVTALALRAERPDIKVGILDIDQHYGNGTDHIIIKTESQGWVKHYTVGRYRMRASDAEGWLTRLPSIVSSLGCDVVLYQAGADPHVDDPYGGFLTTEQLHERDRIVFRTLHKMGIPVAWNLAGGYQTPLRKVLDIHDNTMRACVEMYMENPR